MTTTSQALAWCFGVLLHALLFCRYEWDRHSPKILLTHLILTACIFATFLFVTDACVTQSLVEAFSFDVALVGGLFTSMLVYRLYLHPLRSFPGPLVSRLSSLWAFKQQCPDLRFYVKLGDLHDRYGDFVRISKSVALILTVATNVSLGPRELSIRHPDAINDVHGPKNKIRKGEFYEQIHPAHSLQFTRDSYQHKQQRRYWDKAFHSKGKPS